uniref:glutaminase n=1 Tax=Cyprinus carpio carpio TaxID=630221 RepID=A0A9J7XC47_CYPCA
MEEYSKYKSRFTLTKQGMFSQFIPHIPFFLFIFSSELKSLMFGSKTFGLAVLKYSKPLVETGAIICTSLLQLPTRPVTEEEEKYESVLNIIRRLCNKEHANLNCTSYQNLRKDIIHLHALSFYLQEKKCFPEGVGINSTLDLLLQCLSTEVTCESGAALAATLGNGGLCPLSGDQVMSPHAIRSMLSMMQEAGMNDYSRMFHFKTSVPGKSSQSGVVLIVVPGVLGLMCWSPGLGCNGNSWRGVHFCEELVSTFQLHSFDIRTPFRQVLCYRQ